MSASAATPFRLSLSDEIQLAAAKALGTRQPLIFTAEHEHLNCLSMLYPCALEMDFGAGKQTFADAEHAYQYSKNPEAFDHCKDGIEACKVASDPSFSPTEDWSPRSSITKVLYAKARQCPEFAKTLELTGTAKFQCRDVVYGSFNAGEKNLVGRALKNLRHNIPKHGVNERRQLFPRDYQFTHYNAPGKKPETPDTGKKV
ncbi:MAG: NADAR family protein [Simkaniaceae bacterium]|nr:NADAR family protein [Candidatus Sacchlamyda saccharinae]